MNATRHPFLAAIYDPALAPLEALGLRDQRRRTADAATGKVLEIGAGTGAMFAHYPKAVTDVIAIEPDPEMLRRARRRAVEAPVPVTLQQADAEELPFEDDCFDTVVVALSLCTIPDPDAAVREGRRVLRPDGRLVFLEHVRSGSDVVATIQRVLTPAWERVAGGCQLDRDTLAILERNGFELGQVWRSGDGRGALVQGMARPR